MNSERPSKRPDIVFRAFPLFAVVVVLGFAVPGIRAAEIPTSGLEGFWRFDQLQDDRSEDLSPAGRPLKLDHPRINPESGSARSLLCDGFESAGILDETKPLTFSGGFTLAVWVRPARAEKHDPVVGRPNSNPSWTTPTTGLQLDQGRPIFGLSGGGKLLLEGPILPMHAWSLVAVTLDGKTAAMFVDGKASASTPSAMKVPPANGVPWYVGRDATRYFRGRIGEILVWTRSLDPAEIATLMAATSGRYPPPTIRLVHDRMMEVEAAIDDKETWKPFPTRLLDGLDGFTPGATLPAVDAWGGRLDRPAVRATGFFRTEKIGDRWWLVTPDGHLYFNVAVNAVAAPKNGKDADAAAFARRATDELRELGFNGAGNWSAPSLAKVPHPLPWCLRLDFASTFAKEHGQTYATSGHTGFSEQCLPVFHPDFPQWAERYASALDRTAKDPALLGIFTDNELQCPKDLLDRFLRLDGTKPYFAPLRAAAEAWLSARGETTDPAKLTARDRFEFIGHVFGTYARIVHDAIRRHDKNHLILGSRYHDRTSQHHNPFFWSAVAPYIDVAAVNYYKIWGPQREDIDGWSAAMNRPILLTEWYSKALDAPGLSNKAGAGWLVHTQEDRAAFYQHFALAAMETPSLVGFHYFKYLDDPATSTNLDSAGGKNAGLYTADGAPWTVLNNAARAVNRLAYPLMDFFDSRREPAKVPPEAPAVP